MELQVLEQNAIVAAFAKRGGTDELFDRIAEEARSHVPDVTTKKGRDAIGSLAMKISKSKTIIEKYGKEVVAEQKAQIKLIDDDRISVVKKFDELRNEILAPRDAWEQAEKDRVAKHESNLLNIKSLVNGLLGACSDHIQSLIHRLDEMKIDSSYEEFENQAKIAKFETLELLKKGLADREKYEAEQAELERLRQAEIERQQKERDEKIARDAAEKARIEAKDHINTLTPIQLAANKAIEEFNNFAQSCEEAIYASDLNQLTESLDKEHIYYHNMRQSMVKRAKELGCVFDKERSAWSNPPEFNAISDVQRDELQDIISLNNLDVKEVCEHLGIDALSAIELSHFSDVKAEITRIAVEGFNTDGATQ